MKKLTIIVIILFVLVGIVSQTAPKAQASLNINPCVIVPQLCFPSATPTPTPTPVPCHVDVFLSFKHKEPCPTLTPTSPVEPTITVEPTATPAATETPASTNGTVSSSQPGIPACTIQITRPILQGQERVSATSVKFSWWPNQEGADYYAISYGYSSDNLQYGQPKIDGSQTSITLNDLVPNAQVYAKVIAYKGACASESDVLSSIVLPKAAPATGRAE